jgi:hypothetical protein
MFILMILYDFCLLPTQFCYMIVYIRRVESRVQIADQPEAKYVFWAAAILFLRLQQRTPY